MRIQLGASYIHTCTFKMGDYTTNSWIFFPWINKGLWDPWISTFILHPKYEDHWSVYVPPSARRNHWLRMVETFFPVENVCLLRTELRSSSMLSSSWKLVKLTYVFWEPSNKGPVLQVTDIQTEQFVNLCSKYCSNH